MAAKKKTPVWAWVGCGCILLSVLVAAAIGGAGFLGFSQLKSMVEDMADPLARDEATMRMLGAEALPEGWHSHVFFKLPFILKIAILTDGPTAEAIEGSFEEKTQALENLSLRSDEIGRNLFLYFKAVGRDQEPLEDLLAGRTSHRGQANTQVDLDIEIEPDLKLGDGTLELSNQSIEWRAHSGVMRLVGGELKGIYAVARILCPDGESSDALWFQADEIAQPEAAIGATAADSATAEIAAEAAVESLPDADRDQSGTPADPAALERLFAHFELCK